MGYSPKYEQSIQRVRPFLQELLVAKEEKRNLSWVTPRTIGFAYLIRQALRNAKVHNDNSYKDLKDYFTIREKIEEDKIIVSAIYRPPLTEISSTIDISDSATKHPRLVVDAATTINHVIGAAIAHKIDELEFPNVSLEENDLLSLQKWAILENITLHKLDKGILLIRKGE